MSLRRIYRQGEEVLEKKAHPVTKFDNKLHALLDDMKDTLIEADGAGLAAPQVGILRRVVLVCDRDGVMTELVNPQIVKTAGEQEGFEGCLSLPQLYGIVQRPMEVTVRAQDRHGKEFEITGRGLMARAFCHELDHLDGILFTEYTERLYSPEEIDKMTAQLGLEEEEEDREDT